MILNIQNLNKIPYLFAMANILVTGGTGFIGIPLVKKLHQLGHNLKLLVRESSNTAPFKELSNIEYITGDVQDISSFTLCPNSCNFLTKGIPINPVPPVISILVIIKNK